MTIIRCNNDYVKLDPRNCATTVILAIHISRVSPKLAKSCEIIAGACEGSLACSTCHVIVMVSIWAKTVTPQLGINPHPHPRMAAGEWIRHILTHPSAILMPFYRTWSSITNYPILLMRKTTC